MILGKRWATSSRLKNSCHCTLAIPPLWYLFCSLHHDLVHTNGISQCPSFHPWLIQTMLKTLDNLGCSLVNLCIATQNMSRANPILPLIALRSHNTYFLHCNCPSNSLYVECDLHKLGKRYQESQKLFNLHILTRNMISVLNDQT